MQIKAFSEKFAFDAEWTPSKGTKWRFICVGIFVELLFVLILILLLVYR
jgi:hypothetical protein